jgi:branched-chain amino acid transport system permease protein
MPLMAGFLVALLFVWLAVNFFKGPAYFFTISFIGLTNGAVYALVALGYTLVYGILELINFAHGDVFMLGGMFSATMILSVFNLKSHASAGSLAVAIVISLIVAMTACGLLNATIERIAYRPLRGAPRLAPLITAIGMSFILQDVALAWKGPGYTAIPNVLPHGNVFSISGVSTVGEADRRRHHAPVLLLLPLVAAHEGRGKAMQATAQDVTPPR